MTPSKTRAAGLGLAPEIGIGPGVRARVRGKAQRHAHGPSLAPIRPSRDRPAERVLFSMSVLHALSYLAGAVGFVFVLLSLGQ